MEIHAPHKPILTMKEAAVHLTIVTIGILIALSLEGLLERSRHAALVREARANIASELRSNKNKLERVISELPGMTTRIEHAIDILDRASGGPEAARLFGIDAGSVIEGYDLAELSSASRTTAEVTGAFGIMDYAEVKKYAAAYDRQALYEKVQNDSWNNAMAAFSLGHALDMQKASASEIADIKRQLRLAAGSLIIEQQVAVALTKGYARALGETP
jgi:hypothetical protein